MTQPLRIEALTFARAIEIIDEVRRELRCPDGHDDINDNWRLLDAFQRRGVTLGKLP